MAPSLPVEIWRLIFQHLCIHCQQSRHSDNLPDFRLPCAREGKDALRKLSLVSRECRAMSQDILWHYFYNLSQGGAWTPSTRDLTPRMLRALISNPGLAQSVRMMAIYDQENTLENQFWYDDITRQDLVSWSQASHANNVLVMDEITTALTSEGGDTGALLYFDKPGPTAKLLTRSMEENDGVVQLRDSVYIWMYYLAIKLSPNLTHLQLRDLLDPFEGPSEALLPAFPNVRVLTHRHFMGNIDQVIASLAQFPHVSTFGCYDSMSFATDDASSIPPGLTMNIRKLTLSCRLDELSLFLKYCPHLEDLEVHTYGDDSLMKWPTHTKANLRRLAWSDDNSNDLYGADSSLVLVPLMHFHSLEILEIDQGSLLLSSKARKGEIAKYVLPQTLRILHVAFAQDVSSVAELSDSLLDLAAAKTTILPNLSIVKIGHPVGDDTLAEAMTASGLMSAMEKAGINLKFGPEEVLEIRSSSEFREVRRIIPMLPGSDMSLAWSEDEVIENECELFSLEDLKSL